MASLSHEVLALERMLVITETHYLCHLVPHRLDQVSHRIHCHFGIYSIKTEINIAIYIAFL